MTTNIPREPIDLQLIEWPEVEKLVQNCAFFDETKNNITNTTHDLVFIQNILANTSTLIHFANDQDFLSLVSSMLTLSSDFLSKNELIKLKKSHAIPLSEIHTILTFIEFYKEHFRTIHKYFPDEVNFDQNRFMQLINKDILKEFRSFVSQDGEINLERHPQVRHLIVKIRTIEETIRSSLNHSLSSPDLSSKIQFSTIDIINDRYVIPIKSDAYNRSIGTIVHRSDSGNTLYVEPKNISKLNYQRVELLVELTAIINKIEAKLTKTLQLHLPSITHIMDFTFLLDDISARVKFAIDHELNFPILTERMGFKYKEAFHLLIKDPIKNDISLDEDHEGLIISGPNTGGKTATLKLLAINQLLVRAGLYVPCSECEMHLYDCLFYYGNDNQDINNGLSSFSAEVHGYTNLFNQLKETNLILIDEIFNSTSSEEASALAIALFENINSYKKSHIIVSSHHQTLKTLLHQNDKFISAHVGFNMDNNTPTYKLQYGSPGASQALRIFKHITSKDDHFRNIYERSIQLLDNKSLHYEKLLDSLAHKEHELNKTLANNNQINHELKNQKMAMQGVIKIKIDDAVAKTEKKLHKLIGKAEQLIQDVKQGSLTKPKQVHSKGHSISSELNTFKESDSSDTSKYVNLSIPSQFIEGEHYFSLKLEKTVVLKKIEANKKQALITVGNISMRVPLTTLRVANKSQVINVKPDISIQVETVERSKIEYDCRGMRLEEFEALIQNISSDLMLEKIPFVTIIHGHGTGTLKSWLRSFVKKHPDLMIIPNDTGNDGETQVQLI